MAYYIHNMDENSMYGPLMFGRYTNIIIFIEYVGKQQPDRSLAMERQERFKKNKTA